MSYNEIDRQVEKDEFNKEQKKAIERIRARRSYKKFAEFLDWTRENNPTELTLLKKMHSIINDIMGFGSRTNAIYAFESIEQLAEDRGLV